MGDGSKDSNRERHASGKSDVSTESDGVYIPTPPDGGWGWVIVLASFFNNIIVDGIAYCFGVLYIEFLDYFKDSKGKTSLVGSLLAGTYLCCGPLVSALTNKFGCRPVVIAGSLISTVAFLLSTLSPTIEVLIITYGVMGGVGFGMIYLPSIVSVGYYFERKRALATGIAVCGSGVGTFIFAPLSSALLSYYDWKNTMFIMAGIILHSCFFGALMRPLTPTVTKRKSKPRSKNVLDRLKERTRGRGDSESIHDNDIANGLEEAKLAREQRLRQESMSENQSMLSRRSSRDQTSPTKPIPIPGTSPTHTVAGSSSVPKVIVSDSSSSLTTIKENHQYHDSNGVAGSPTNAAPSLSSSQPVNGKAPARQRGSSKHASDDADAQPGDSLLAVPGTSHRSKIGSSISVIWEKAVKRAESQDKIQKEDYARPLYRQDIFYSGSVLNIQQFRSQPDMKTYITSITSIPDVGQMEAESKFWRVCCCCCPKPFTDVLSRMLDLKIFKNYGFLIICIANVFGMVGFYVPFVYITDRAVLLGIEESKASFLLSIIGITNTIGRVLFGLLADHPRIDALWVNNITMTLAAVATILSPFCMDYVSLVVYCAVFGLLISAYISLTSIILCDLLGLDQLTTAFGVLTLARGIASTAGPPIAGAVYDATESYAIAFYTAGAFLLAGAALQYLLFIPGIKQKNANQPLEGDVEMADMSDSAVKSEAEK